MPASQTRQVYTIVVCGHRGGSAKTTASALLGHALAKAGVSTLIVDFSIGAGVSSLDVTQREGRIAPWTKPDQQIEILRFNNVPLGVLSAPGMMAAMEAHEKIAQFALENGYNIVLYDTPTADMTELSISLRLSDIALMTMPCDANAFRSVIPFLEYLQEDRSKPNRDYQIKAILLDARESSRTTDELREHVEKFLAPIMVPHTMPFDVGISKSISQGQFPAGPSEKVLQWARATSRELLQELGVEQLEEASR